MSSAMPDPILSRYTPRQIADAIVCAVMDVVNDEVWDRPGTPDLERRRTLRRSDAVLDVLKGKGVTFVDGTADYWGGK
jgi:hypothetical protein